MSLTTQQAADLLDVSRPTMVELIENGDLPAERISSRLRLRLRDVLAYQQARKQAQYEALAASSDEIDDNEDPEVVHRRLTEARRSVSARRKAKG
ncbi:helix-turn-helix domain-containing protein [Nocardia sp. NBC_00511]|uniref:helix-turn-helix domain-containing protein n=1 Tax=Nocardia sp. NBC_00511 TaxID=2903591 RepID=UPI0030E46B39